ncbi:hypothetical protein HG263_20490 [Pseudoalteromonas sp. JBTF-M23]|uniref:Uncharacterized protein n=1 Tax=Pseudoalteromonas caenipelagi TaxID=2726988 RepID=A0A849VHX7_9GAMM|nr:hypothetical protein [Pseudoalteromonas caenipelagi]NOU52885.1 hypothetical protein [Pseudoalteromonas caenipelagi]
MKRQNTLILLCVCLQVGCKHNLPFVTHKALLTNTSPAVKKRIQDAVVKLKGGVTPQLADNVFMISSTLMLEQGMNKPGYEPILGEHDISVTRLELQIRNGQCVLYYPKKDKYIELNNIQCKAVTSIH